MPNLAQISNFEVITITFLLVISTVSAVSMVSTLVSQHFCSFAHCPYHARSMSIIAYYNNTRPHHLRLQKYVLPTLFLLFWQW